MADLDADGIYELLLATYTGFRVLDGVTGDVLAELPELQTGPRDAAPVVADVDGDGSAEILVNAGEELVALGPASGRWARTRPVWNQLAYDVTTIRDDGSLVAAPAPVWSAYGTFRAQPAHDGERPDLAVTAAAGSSCGATTIAVEVRNQGSVEAAAGATLRVLATSGAGLVDVASTTLAEPIAPGQRVLAELVIEEALVAAGWVVEVVPAHADECDRTNDRADAWRAPVAPPT